jgi:hypothetical protein
MSALAYTRTKTVPGMSLVTSMYAVNKHAVTQLAHFEGARIAASAKEAEMIGRQAEAARQVAERWATLAALVAESTV